MEWITLASLAEEAQIGASPGGSKDESRLRLKRGRRTEECVVFWFFWGG